MATNSLQTLQIKEFQGVNRFVQGTARKPFYFNNLSNMHQPNPGELKSLGGITKLNGSAMTGVEEMDFIKFLDLGRSEKPLICFYDPNVSSIPAPSGMIFSTSGGGATSRNVYIEYVGPGNSYSKSTAASQSIEADGLSITTPTNVPDYIYCIHVYIADSGGTNYVWSGSFTRRANVFPASITCPLPGAPAANVNAADWTPGRFTVTFGTGGNLTDKRQYFFALSPWVSAANIIASYKTSNDNVMSCYVPEGKSTITIDFTFAPNAIVDDIAAPYTTELAVNYAVVFFGPTLEDGLIAGHNVVNGAIVPKATSTQQSLTISAVSAGADTVTVTGHVPELARLKYHAATSADSGLTNDAYYYARNVVYNSATNVSVFGLSTEADGAVANLAADAVGTQTLLYRNFQIIIKEIPESSNMWSLADSLANLTNSDRNGYSLESRAQGLAQFRQAATPTSRDPQGLGCFALTALPYSPTTRREILTNLQQSSFTVQDHTPDSDTLSEFFVSADDTIQSRQYVNNLWFVNGYNSPFYSNGYVCKPAVVDGTEDPDTDPPNWFPITDFLEFFQEKLCLAGMSGNAVYQEQFVYYSLAGNPNNFGSGNTDQAILVRGSDPSEILGLNIYSQDLSNIGPQTFLVTGKRGSIFTWDGATDSAAQQIDKSVGFAGPNCYTLTRFGPVYVGRDNVYLLRTSQDIVPVGDGIKDYIQALTNDQLFLIQAVYQDEEMKIGLPSAQSTQLVGELWLRMWYDKGGIQTSWSGLHEMKEYTIETVLDEYQEERSYRASIEGPNLYRRDDPGSYLNDGQPIHRAITINNLGMTADHLVKLICGLYMGLQISKDEEFDVTLESQDGSESLVFSTGIEAQGNLRQMLQCMFPQRFLARVLQLSVENISDAALSIFDFSILFQPIRRRRIP